MKTINFVQTPDFEAMANAGISLICDENMNLIISDEDYERLRNEFPAAYDDSYEVEEEKRRRYAVCYYPNKNDVRYIGGSIVDYIHGGLADPVLMTKAEAEEMVADLDYYVRNEERFSDRESALYAYDRKEWGFGIEEFEDHVIEDVELVKHNNGGDYLSWTIDGVDGWAQGEFLVDKYGILHHMATAPNGDDVEITIKY